MEDSVKYIYRCPYENSCRLRKHCRVLTAAEKLDHPIKVWIVCPDQKSNGVQHEILTVIG